MLLPRDVFNKTCPQTSYGIHRPCEGTNTFTPTSSIVTLLEEFSRFTIFRVSKNLPGAHNFPLDLQSSQRRLVVLLKNSFSFWKCSLSAPISFFSQICVFFELSSSLPLTDSILETPGKKLGKNPSFLGSDVSCVPSEPNVLRFCHCSATGTALPADATYRSGSEHRVWGDRFPFAFCISLGIFLGIFSIQLEQQQDFLSLQPLPWVSGSACSAGGWQMEEQSTPKGSFLYQEKSFVQPHEHVRMLTSVWQHTRMSHFCNSQFSHLLYLRNYGTKVHFKVWALNKLKPKECFGGEENLSGKWQHQNYYSFTICLSSHYKQLLIRLPWCLEISVDWF